MSGNPLKKLHINRHVLRFYKLPESKDALRDVPKVNVDVASVAKDMVIPLKKTFLQVSN